MASKTLVHYKDSDGNDCIKSTAKFNNQTAYKQIVEWVLTWLWGSFAFDLKIKDPSIDEEVDFDEDYMEDQNPYINQSMTSIIRLRVLQTSGGRHRNSAVNDNQQASNQTVVINSAQYQKYIPNIPINATWKQNGMTVAGGREIGNATNQLHDPEGLVIDDDDDQTIVIVERSNHRIIQWKIGDTNGQVVAGGNGEGNRLDQLKYPSAVLIDKETDSLIICDLGNERVVRWPRRRGTKQGKILIDKIVCQGLAMDDQRYLYVSDHVKNEVRRYQIGGDMKNGQVVAGGNGVGAGLNQLYFPLYIFVDRQQTVYVSDRDNHRVMKWNKGAKEGMVVAGGQGQGNALTQLSCPYGLVVDTLGTIYVVDAANHRVMRWPQGAKQGTIIVGKNAQLDTIRDLSFDRYGNLYVIESALFSNHRVQHFSIE